MKYGEDYCIVQEGDTLETIAERYLGDRMLVPLLLQINDIPDVELPTGMKLLLHPTGLEKENKYLIKKGEKRA